MLLYPWNCNSAICQVWNRSRNRYKCRLLWLEIGRLFQKHEYNKSKNYFEISISKEKKGLDKISSGKYNGTKSVIIHLNTNIFLLFLFIFLDFIWLFFSFLMDLGDDEKCMWLNHMMHHMILCQRLRT